MKPSLIVLLVSMNVFAAQIQHERPTQFVMNGHFVEFDSEDPLAFGQFTDDEVEVLSGYLKEVLMERASGDDLRRSNRAIHVQVQRGLDFERSVINHRGYTRLPALTEYHLYVSALASGEQVKAFLREQFEDLPERKPVISMPLTPSAVREGWCRRLLTKAFGRASAGK